MSALVTFFALQYRDIEVNWWGNDIPSRGCEGSGTCAIKTLADGEYFGSRVGTFH